MTSIKIDSAECKTSQKDYKRVNPSVIHLHTEIQHQKRFSYTSADGWQVVAIEPAVLFLPHHMEEAHRECHWQHYLCNREYHWQMTKEEGKVKGRPPPDKATGRVFLDKISVRDNSKVVVAHMTCSVHVVNRLESNQHDQKKNYIKSQSEK